MSGSDERGFPPPGSVMHDILVATGQLSVTRAEEHESYNRLFETRDQSSHKTQVDTSSPLEQLHKQVLEFFPENVDKKTSEKMASIKFAALQTAIGSGDLAIRAEHLPPPSLHPVIAERVPWRSCKLAATLVLILAAPKSRVDDALAFQSMTMNRLTMASINSTSSADLKLAFKSAKKAAIDGKFGKVTIIGVNLVDVGMIERAENRPIKGLNYTSFAHSFVLSIGRAGVRIYQAWGKEGYSLVDWIDRDKSRIRSWKEAEDFIKTFARLTSHKVKAYARV